MTRDDAPARLHIDWTQCDGRGLCVELLPGLLTADDWGYPLVRDASATNKSTVPIPAAELDAAAQAVKLCPRLALTLHLRQPGA